MVSRTPVGWAPPTAPVLLVFGRGVDCVDGGYRLGPDGLARVHAAVDYVAAHRDEFQRAARRGRPPRVVFTGGWADACEGAAAPPAGSREGDLMLRAARAAGLHRYADLRVESRSRSTLENLVHTAADGLLAGWKFGARQPLGLVSHSWHLPRVRLLAAKVLGLRGPALRDVPVSDADPRGRRSERAARLACRVAYLGVGDPAALLRRERAMVATLRRAERLGAALGLGGPATDEAPGGATRRPGRRG